MEYSNEFELANVLTQRVADLINENINYDNDKDQEEIEEGVNEEYFSIIEDMIIYYNDQYNIINICRNTFDFNEDNDLGIEIKNVMDLAFVNLYNFINERDILSKGIELYNNEK